jgi:hypothetical protein
MAKWYDIEGSLDDKIVHVVSEWVKRGKSKEYSDRRVLRAAINLMRTRVRKVDIGKISTGQFRRIWKKYQRNVKTMQKREAMIVAVRSGMSKSKAGDSQ